MHRKKILALGLATIVAVGLLTGCGSSTDTKETASPKATTSSKATASGTASSTQQKTSYADGNYHAEEKEFTDGWKNTVDITVKDGKIVSVDWNAINEKGGKDKKTLSKDGEYGMVAKGGAKKEWHEQAALVEKYLIEKQDPAAITYKDEQGHTDAISGATIKVKEFFTLAKEALSKGPVK